MLVFDNFLIRQVLNLKPTDSSSYFHHFSTVIDFSSEKSTVVLLDTGTPGTSGGIFSEDADDGTRTRNPLITNRVLSHWAIQLKSYCWEGVDFIQLVYRIIIFLSFLNCDWLLIREVQWFCWTQELLVTVEKFSVRMPMMGFELATPRLQTEIQLKSYCWEGVEFMQLV